MGTHSDRKSEERMQTKDLVSCSSRVPPTEPQPQPPSTSQRGTPGKRGHAVVVPVLHVAVAREKDGEC